MNDKVALEFAAKVGEIKEGLPRVNNHQMATALGLSEDGMDETLTILSLEIIRQVGEGKLGFEAQAQMFQLGIDLGRAYERHVAEVK